jgi:hypothetical protein
LSTPEASPAPLAAGSCFACLFCDAFRVDILVRSFRMAFSGCGGHDVDVVAARVTAPLVPPDAESAVLKIQAAFRGFRARRQLRECLH